MGNSELEPTIPLHNSVICWIDIQLEVCSCFSFEQILLLLSRVLRQLKGIPEEGGAVTSGGSSLLGFLGAKGLARNCSRFSAILSRIAGHAQAHVSEL